LLCILAGCAPKREPQPTPANTPHHHFEDAKRWSRVFDDPKRDAWQKPDLVIGELALRPTDVVADLGCGTGYFTTRLARVVREGRVLAVDIEPDMIEHVKERAKKDAITNVVPVLASANDPKLPDGVHLVLVVDTYHHISDRTRYFQNVKTRLARDGRVVIVDFKPGKLPVGPPEEHKISPEVTTREMTEAGYRACGSFDGLDYQYMLSFCVE
jgi:SAM-dependent methyltransferase